MSVEGIRLMNGLLWQQKGPPRRSGAHKYFGLAPAAVGDFTAGSGQKNHLATTEYRTAFSKGETGVCYSQISHRVNETNQSNPPRATLISESNPDKTQ